MLIDDGEARLVRDYVLNQYPNEAIVVKTNSGLEFVENTAQDKQRAFAIDSVRALQLYTSGIQFVIHSHTTIREVHKMYDIRTPSKTDMLQQMAMGVPWGIVGTEGETMTDILWYGDQVPKQSLWGRNFVHGVQDCYALVRDWYFEQGITLKDYARELGWWDGEDAINLYVDNFADAGFVEVPLSSISIGDVVLMKIASKVVNHAGVYLGDNIIGHHVFGKLSCKESFTRYLSRVDRVVRYGRS